MTAARSAVAAFLSRGGRRRNHPFCYFTSECRRQFSSSSSLFSHHASTRDDEVILGNVTEDAFQDVPKDVVIVGGGPTGIALRALFSSFDVKNVLLIERYSNGGPSKHPKAHFINRRTMEILRDRNAFGFGEKTTVASRVREEMSDVVNWRHFRYVTGILDEKNEELGSVDHFATERMEIGETTASTEGVAHFPQHRLMPMLWENALEKAKKRRENYDDDDDDDAFVRGDEVVRVERLMLSSRSVKSSSSSRGGSKNRCRVTLKSGKVFEAKYVVACDGASSVVARTLNSEGRETKKKGTNTSFPTQTLGNIHFVSRSLAKRIKEKSNEAMLYFVFNKNIVGVVVAHDLREGEFALQLPYHAPVQDFKEMFTKKKCEMFVRNAISGGGIDVDDKNGVTVDDIEVLDVKSWTMDATVANVVIDEERAPRIILAGDAMHAFPPAGGFGMNTGIQDAHNLAWKLAIAIQNEHDDDALSSSLLNSYANERKKIASENKTLSVSNYERVLEIPRALGLEPRALDALVFASNALPVPQALKSFAFEKILSAGRMQTVLLESDKKNPLGEYRREAVKRLCGTSGETLKLKFLNEELGFSYAKGVKATNPNVLAVGKRIPHCALINADEGGGTISTIDLGGSNSKFECQFFAITSSSVNVDEDALEEARKMLPKGAALKLVVVSSSSDKKDEKEPKTTTTTKKKGDNGGDNYAIYIDPSNAAWTSILEEYNAKNTSRADDVAEVILCRPDAHVAFVGSFARLPNAARDATRGHLIDLIVR